MSARAGPATSLLVACLGLSAAAVRAAEPGPAASSATPTPTELPATENTPTNAELPLPSASDLSTGGIYRTGNHWNAELEGGWVFEPHRHGDLKVQLGWLWIEEPKCMGLGVFGEETFGLGAAGGVITSYTDSVHGNWNQVGVVWDQFNRGGFLLAAGWSLFGIEAQRRFQSASLPSTDWQLELKLRIPIGLLLFVTRHP